MTAPTLPQDDRSFIGFLARLEDGVLQKDLTEQLRGLVAAMHQQHRDAGGKPTARLTLALNFRLDGGIIEVQAVVTPVPPKPVRARSIFYRASDDLLSPNNPKQLDLGIAARDVTSATTADVRLVR
jgi:hypothetical protein